MNSDHEEDCQCFTCKNGLEAREAWIDEMMEKHGWFVDGVQDPSYPYGIQFHTHGLMKTYEHVDLQIIFNLGLKTANKIFWSAVNQIKEGKKFSPGEEASEVIENMNVLFLPMIENQRPVLRIVFPDVNGELDKNKIEDMFKDQWEWVEDVEDEEPNYN